MKKYPIWLISFIALLGFALVACGGGGTVEEAVQDAADAAEEVVEDVADEVEEAAEAVEDAAEEVMEEAEEAMEEVMDDDRGVFRVAHAVAWGGTENMDPVDGGRFYPAIALVYDRLAEPGLDGRPSPSLAESWEGNDTADVWTFNLRDDVFFHDGAQLTSADVVYSMNYWKTSETSTIAPVFALVGSVEAPDDFTVVVNLDQPHADFPLLITDYRARIFPEGAEEEILTTGRGSGPFTLEKLDVEGTTVLVANDDYWGGKPGVAQIEVLAIPDAEARTQALLAGQIDWEDVTPQQAQLFEGNGDYNVEQIPTGDWSGLIMRTDSAPFDDVLVRRAMRLVADRQAMVDLVLDGAGSVSCDTPVMPGDQYKFDTDCSQNVEEAVALLAEAGYPDGIEVDLFTSDVCADFIPLAEVYQLQAAEAGITVNINQVPTDGYWTDAWMVEPFAMTCWGERPADQILNEAYRSGGSWNETYWNVEEYDGLLDAARQELDFDARRDNYLGAQELLWTDGGALIPYHNNALRVTRSCVDGIAPLGSLRINWLTITKPADCS